ncbi:cytochrome P450 [Streptomyces sp. LP05-1]|uniref:Cytochrome P450 n=1 Tax=Streptomyces pyxinae TaxID=2970734 RepID=A0ABT2CGP8_9ACTN|nr:cytochrome P450 [Streptomyces sp. LP05-1]MCS0635779.1 cytochrome P450 [Streptomyces sp. LP05-1]
MITTGAHGHPVLTGTAEEIRDQIDRLRRQSPVVKAEAGGVLGWLILSHDLIKELAVDPRVSRDLRNHGPEELRTSTNPMVALARINDVSNLYGEEHRAERARLSGPFTHRRVQAMESAVRREADRLTGELAATAPGEVADLRQKIARPLPAAVICDLLGVPDHLRGPLLEAIDAMVDLTERPPAQVAEDIARLRVRMDELRAYKLANPADDLSTAVVRPPDGRPPLPEDAQRDTLFGVIGAGYETTVNLITAAFFHLLRDRAAVRDLLAGRVDYEDVVEETLRLQGPLSQLPFRYAREDIRLDTGAVIRKGEVISFMYAVAGRDPAVHAEGPNEFQPSRPVKSHVAFGHGVHHCPGSSLGRLEAVTVLRAVMTALPDMTLADPESEPPLIPSMVINGFTSLPVVPHPLSSGA